jgi:hypothetical protein
MVMSACMPMILRGPSIAAGATNDNLLSGSSFEFARGRGVMSCGITADSAGAVANIQAGGDIVAESFPVPVLARYPIIPDEMYFTEVVEVGDRLVQRVQNGSVGAMVVRSVTQLSFGG